MGLIMGYLWLATHRQRLHRQKGWLFIVGGFALVSMGGIFDITDNFESLNRFVIVGDTVPQAYLEKVVGNLLGTILILIGFLYWLPLVSAARKADEIKAALAEKEVLLKEVHHRVKNNLQLISSLLNLQAAKSPDVPGVEMLHDSQNRIKAMALIHEKLYRSGDFANIDFGEYARGLVADLFHSYKIDPTAVSSHVDIDDVKLTVETAMPCGLIINELIANALEHGFPNGRHGDVRIELHPVDDRTALLTVRDTGVGSPKELDFRQTESLGMQLVTTLTAQIGGAIELDRSAGTAFHIRFPLHQSAQHRPSPNTTESRSPAVTASPRAPAGESTS